MEYLLSFLPSTPYLLPVVLTILALVVLWFGLPQRGCRRTNCKRGLVNRCVNAASGGDRLSGC